MRTNPFPLLALIGIAAMPLAAGCGSLEIIMPADTTPAIVTGVSLADKTDEQIARLADVPLSRLRCTTATSSAVRVRPDLLLVCRHSLVSPDDRYEIDGAPRRVTVVDGGRTDAWRDDWALLQLDEPTEGPTLRHLAPDGPIDPGRRMLLVGYWGGSKEVRALDLGPTGLAVVDATVIAPPPYPKSPTSAALLCCSVPVDLGGGALHGLSGGPALMWDDGLADWVVVGHYRGSWRLIADDDTTIDSAQVVRRLPAAVRRLVEPSASR